MGFKNGYRTNKQPQFGPGGDRLDYNQLNENEIALLENYKPSLITSAVFQWTEFSTEFHSDHESILRFPLSLEIGIFL